MQAKTLQELIDDVLGETDPRRRERARDRMAARVFQIAHNVALKLLPSEADDVAQDVVNSVESHLLAERVSVHGMAS